MRLIETEDCFVLFSNLLVSSFLFCSGVLLEMDFQILRVTYRT